MSAVSKIAVPLVSGLLFIGGAYGAVHLSKPPAAEPAKQSGEKKKAKLETRQFSFPVFDDGYKVGYCVLSIKTAIVDSKENKINPEKSIIYSEIFSLASEVLNDTVHGANDCSRLAASIPPDIQITGHTYREQ